MQCKVVKASGQIWKDLPASGLKNISMYSTVANRMRSDL